MKIINVGSKMVNSYLVPVGENFLLVDTGGKNSFAKFTERLNGINIGLDKIKYVFLTHAHSDHAGFLRELLEKTNAVLIYNEKAKPRLEAGKNNMRVYVSSFTNLISSYISTAFLEKTQYFPSVNTNNYINCISQPLNEFNLEFVELGGHTAGDAGLKYNGNFFCGDVCMNGIGSVKYFPCWCENKFELIKSWEKIIEDKDIITIYPGHGKPFPKKELINAIEYWRNRGVMNLFKRK